MAQVTESDYKQAQQGDAKVRQEFLDAIDLEDAGEFIREFEYVPNFSVMLNTNNQPNTLMQCLFPRIYSPNKDLMEKFKQLGFFKSKIIIFSEAFNQSCGLFLSSLYHEKFHAEQLYLLPEMVFKLQEKADFVGEGNIEKSREILSLLEMPAYLDQQTSANRFNLRAGEKFAVYEAFQRERKRFVNARKIYGNHFDEDAIVFALTPELKRNIRSLINYLDQN